MKRSCNLCGKQSLLLRKYFFHGENRFLLCIACSKRIRRLKDQTQYKAARAYLESKMHQGVNEQISFILSNQIRNAVPVSVEERSQSGEGKTEENGIVLWIQSVGVLGGGILFLFGICMLNIHLKVAVITLIAAVLLGVILYSAGLCISLLLQYIKRK